MKLKLEQIIIDKGTQTRDEIDQKTVTEYAEALLNKESLPPVTVFYDGINYYLADGFHRYFGHKQTKMPTIEADVINGTLRNALEYALGTNDKHGLKRTNKEGNQLSEVRHNHHRTVNLHNRNNQPTPSRLTASCRGWNSTYPSNAARVLYCLRERGVNNIIPFLFC